MPRLIALLAFCMLAMSWAGSHFAAPYSTLLSDPFPERLSAAEHRINPRVLRSSTGPYRSCAFRGGLCGFVDADGVTVIAAVYDDVKEFEGGHAIVRLGDDMGVIDTQGNIIVQPAYDEIALDTDRLNLTAFQPVLAVARQGDRVSLLGSDGAVLFEAEGAAAIHVSPVHVLVARKSPDWQPNDRLVDFDLMFARLIWGHELVIHDNAANTAQVLPCITVEFLRRTGEPLLSCERQRRQVSLLEPDGTLHDEVYESIGRNYASSELFIVSERYDIGSGNRTLVGAIDAKGNVVLPIAYEGLGRFSDNGLAAYATGQRDDRRWGYIDTTGAVVIPATYESAGEFNEEGLATVTRFGASFRIDRTGARPAECRGTPLIAEVRVDGERGHILLDENGRRINDEIYDIYDAASAECGQPIWVWQNERLSLLNHDGTPLTSVTYDIVSRFEGGFAMVEVAPQRVGIIDREGNYVLSPMTIRASIDLASYGSSIYSGQERIRWSAETARALISDPSPLMIPRDRAEPSGPDPLAGEHVVHACGDGIRLIERITPHGIEARYYDATGAMMFEGRFDYAGCFRHDRTARVAASGQRQICHIDLRGQVVEGSCSTDRPGLSTKCWYADNPLYPAPYDFAVWIYRSERDGYEPEEICSSNDMVF